LSGSIERLENGLAKLSMAAEQVDGLQEKLNVQEGELAEAGRRVTEMLNRVFADSQQMEKEREFADIEEQRVNAIAEEVALHRTACQKYEYVNAGISNKF
jgi:dynein heavy chain